MEVIYSFLFFQTLLGNWWLEVNWGRFGGPGISQVELTVYYKRIAAIRIVKAVLMNLICLATVGQPSSLPQAFVASPVK